MCATEMTKEAETMTGSGWFHLDDIKTMSTSIRCVATIKDTEVMPFVFCQWNFRDL